ncbi:hypothetical protein NDU88_010557 [Pleurodeles waltl]|uniref:Uncharacterized protein n=1 Tax=Pleurodeles waltl TaxID=8319 RepID=A0AAV7S102_PLEWA|nr:hypothetical protein NDU88_010557 [Pleurodeles waltl]
MGKFSFFIERLCELHCGLRSGAPRSSDLFIRGSQGQINVRTNVRHQAMTRMFSVPLVPGKYGYPKSHVYFLAKTGNHPLQENVKAFRNELSWCLLAVKTALWELH